jgi:hydroxyacylglutathione hydrolase
VLFCGDTLFSLGCGRLFEGSPAQMLDSLDRLAALPGDTLVCCTHEYTLANARFAREADPQNPALRARIAEVEARRARGLPSLPVSLQRERDCNPFLRVRSTGVRAALQARVGLSAEAEAVEAFAALRAWKDGFHG